MRHPVIIKAPFATPEQTAKALGVSASRQRELIKILMSHSPSVGLDSHNSVKRARDAHASRKVRSSAFDARRTDRGGKSKTVKRTHASKGPRSRGKHTKGSR
jgi:hypothetical protein